MRFEYSFIVNKYSNKGKLSKKERAKTMLLKCMHTDDNQAFKVIPFKLLVI